MTFKKWPSIENHYRTEFIERFLSEFPELARETYVITEKLHGCNVQIYFQPGQPWQLGKRTAFLAEGEKFHDVQAVLLKHEHTCEFIQAYVDIVGSTIRLFGEFVSPGIQKGVDYGPNKQIRFFGAMVNDQLVCFHRFQRVAMLLEFEPYLVPIVTCVKGLDHALERRADFLTALNPVEGNIAEGVVIQPYWRVCENAGGKRFMLKKKNPQFLEKAREKKPPPPPDTEVERLNAEFVLYITDNRLQGIFSKHGPITERPQIPEYIRLMLADATEDFLKDHGPAFETLAEGQRRKVLNVGGLIANMLKRCL